IILPGGSGRWKGILRVPVSLNPATGTLAAAGSGTAALVHPGAHLCSCNESRIESPAATGGMAAAMGGAGFTVRDSSRRDNDAIVAYPESPSGWPGEDARNERLPRFGEDARDGGGTGTCEEICPVGGLTGSCMFGHDADTAPHILLCLDEDAELAKGGLDCSPRRRDGYIATDDVALPAACTSRPCIRWSEAATAATATTAAATAVASATTAITEGHSSLILACSASYSSHRWMEPTATFDSRPSAQRSSTAHGYSFGAALNGGSGGGGHKLCCAHSTASVSSACDAAAPRPPRPNSAIPSPPCHQLRIPQGRMSSSLIVPNSSDHVGEAPCAVNDPLVIAPGSRWRPSILDAFRSSPHAATSSFATLLVTPPRTHSSLARDLMRTGPVPVVPLDGCHHHQNHHQHHCDHHKTSSKGEGKDASVVAANPAVESLSMYESAPAVSYCRSSRPHRSTVSCRGLRSSLDSGVAFMATASVMYNSLGGRMPSASASSPSRPPPALPRALAFAMSLGTSPLATVAGGSGKASLCISSRHHSTVGGSITAAPTTAPIAASGGASRNGFTRSLNGPYDGIEMNSTCCSPPAVAVTEVALPPPPPPRQSTHDHSVTPIATAHPFASQLNSSGCAGSAGVDDRCTEPCGGGVFGLTNLMLPQATPPQGPGTHSSLETANVRATEAGQDHNSAAAPPSGVTPAVAAVLRCVRGPRTNTTATGAHVTTLHRTFSPRITECDTMTVASGGSAATPSERPMRIDMAAGPGLGFASGTSAHLTAATMTAMMGAIVATPDSRSGAPVAAHAMVSESTTAAPVGSKTVSIPTGDNGGTDKSPRVSSPVPLGMSKSVVGRPSVPSSPPPSQMPSFQQQHWQHPQQHDTRTQSKQQMRTGGQGQEHQQHRRQVEEPMAVEDNLHRGLECWHECWATSAQDPLTGAEVIVLIQTDVTAKVIAERHLALVMETEHRLVEQLFPRHILQYITEEWTAAHQLVKGQAAEAGAGAGGGSGEGYMPGSGGGRGPGCAAGESLRWRPVVRDCNALATWHPEVTLLFADIQGFTSMCEQIDPQQVMMMLNSLYSRYDAMLDTYGVYKVETIGDCYFVAGGLIHEDEDGMVAVREGSNTEDPLHAEKIFMFAKAMLSAAREVVMPTTGEPVQIRIGLHTGPVVSGVVGTRMPRFCLFGDTVNTASRMESTGVPGAIHASEATFNRLPVNDQWEPTGGIEVKGKGFMQTYLWRPCALIVGAEGTASATNGGDVAIASDVTSVPADATVIAAAANLSTSKAKHEEEEAEEEEEG
ncbi:hypothetical protein Vretimale_17188, partial [Volvox reticuliferus]